MNEFGRNLWFRMVRRVPWRFLLVFGVFACGIFVWSLFISRTTMESENFTVYAGSVPFTYGGPVIAWGEQLSYQATLPPKSGYRSPERKFLTIGISTIYRTENYLQQTLESFVKESTTEERNCTTIIIYLADTDPEAKQMQLKLIQDNFRAHLDSGFIIVIESSSAIYPPMDFVLTKRTFNDSTDRVIWRTKQVIDFAFLFSYAKDLSEYYLVAEDDIITATQYISAIRDFIKRKHQRRWVALEFSEFLGIGLLFHNRDLPTLIELLIMFHQYQPVDMLMREFISIQVQDTKESLKRIPSLFQHIGKRSTLPNKTQDATDNSFGSADRRHRHQNPQAHIFTTMTTYNGFSPDLAYKPFPGYFWGIPDKPGPTFDIFFQTPLNISRVLVVTGIRVERLKKKLKDTIIEGDLEVSDTCGAQTNVGQHECTNFERVGSFDKGVLDLTLNLVNVECLRIKIGLAQKSWVIIREIEVFPSRTKVES